MLIQHFRTQRPCMCACPASGNEHRPEAQATRRLASALKQDSRQDEDENLVLDSAPPPQSERTPAPRERVLSVLADAPLCLDATASRDVVASRHHALPLVASGDHWTASGAMTHHSVVGTFTASRTQPFSGMTSEHVLECRCSASRCLIRVQSHECLCVTHCARAALPQQPTAHRAAFS